MFNEFLAVTKALGSAAGVVEKVSEAYGFIEECEIIEFKGRTYKLVWDYIIYNEITLEDIETGRQMKMFTSFSDRKTKAKFNEILSKLSDK